jgi:hypothetical protein
VELLRQPSQGEDGGAGQSHEMLYALAGVKSNESQLLPEALVRGNPFSGDPTHCALLLC